MIDEKFHNYYWNISLDTKLIELRKYLKIAYGNLKIEWNFKEVKNGKEWPNLRQ